MAETNFEGFELVYITLPKGLIYDPAHEADTRDERSSLCEELIERTMRDLESRAAKILLPPIKMQWIGADGKTLWSDKAQAANAEAFLRMTHPGHPGHGARISGPALSDWLTKPAASDKEIEAFIEGMLAAIEDVNIPLFVVFQGSDGKQAKFYLRFT
jgi:hypothetical protein